MKRICALVAFVLLLSGCKGVNNRSDRAAAMRSKLLGSSGYTFETEITADYSDKLYTFRMACSVDSAGTLMFTVAEPETIKGVTGIISQTEGKLTFDGQALMFERIADGQITPVSAPWFMVHALRGGYINGCAEEDDGIQLYIDDSYMDHALKLVVRTDDQLYPKQAEVFWEGRRVLSMTVESFTFL